MDINPQISELKTFYKSQLTIHKKSNGENIYSIKFNNYSLIIDYLGIYIPPIIVINPILKLNFINFDGKVLLDKLISWNYKVNLLELIRKIEYSISNSLLIESKDNYHRSYSTQLQVNNHEYNSHSNDIPYHPSKIMTQSQIITNSNSLLTNTNTNTNASSSDSPMISITCPSKEELKKSISSKYTLDELILLYYNKESLMKHVINEEINTNQRINKTIKDKIESSKNKLYEILNYQMQFDVLNSKIPLTEEELKGRKEEKSLFDYSKSNESNESNEIEGSLVGLIEKYSKEKLSLSSSLLNKKISVCNKEEFEKFVRDYNKSGKKYYLLNFILERIRNGEKGK